MICKEQFTLGIINWHTNHAGIKIMIEYDILNWPKGNEDVKTYYVHYVEGLEATAARRL